MECRVTIEWTTPAMEGLRTLPLKVRKGLIDKLGAFQKSDPRVAGKPLVGPFQGLRRLTYGRYRAIYSVYEKPKKGGEILLQVKVVVVAAGIRKEHDKKDIYRLAKKLLDLGLIPSNKDPDS